MDSWKIDFLGSPPPSSESPGVDRAQWELAAALVDHGHRVRVLYPTSIPAPPPPYRGVEGIPVPVLDRALRPIPRLRDTGRRASDCLDPAVDLVVGSDERAGALRLPRRGGGRPAFALHFHAVTASDASSPSGRGRPDGIRGLLGGWLDRRALRKLGSDAFARARFVAASSERVREALVRLHRWPPDRITVLPLAIPDPANAETREQARLALRIPYDVPAVLFVGRRPDAQGLPIAAEAFRRARVFFPGARFLVVGCTPKSEPGTIALGVADETTKARAFRAADLLLLPSREAGPSLAVREAMRYALPVLVSERVEMEGAARPHEFRSVASEDPAEYAAELAELLADSTLRRKVGEAGRSVADRCSPNSIARRFEQLAAPALRG